MTKRKPINIDEIWEDIKKLDKIDTPLKPIIDFMNKILSQKIPTLSTLTKAIKLEDKNINEAIEAHIKKTGKPLSPGEWIPIND